MQNTSVIKLQEILSHPSLQRDVHPRILVTAGPTCEDIDSVRFITNRSTGRMGMHIAEAARNRDWPVLLILGPTAVALPEQIPCMHIRSAAEMLAAVQNAFAWCDVLVMTAAVADYTPAEFISGKKKKEEGDFLLRLKRTADILGTIARHPDRATKTVIGFALEPELNLEEGKRKLESKHLDHVVVNTTASFGANTSRACILHRTRAPEDLGTVDKAALAEQILSLLEQDT